MEIERKPAEFRSSPEDSRDSSKIQFMTSVFKQKARLRFNVDDDPRVIRNDHLDNILVRSFRIGKRSSAKSINRLETMYTVHFVSETLVLQDSLA